MEKKIMIEPHDFKLIVEYINEIPVPFNRIELALKVKEVLFRARMIDTKFEDPKQDKKS